MLRCAKIGINKLHHAVKLKGYQYLADNPLLGVKLIRVFDLTA